MFNLLCFPHYTCGGLLCDIMADTFSPLAANGGISSINHSLGKISDSDTIFDNFNSAEVLSDLKKIKVDKDCWVGTHCWPGLLDTSQFGQIIAITTTTYRSKLYRWIRAYHHYYKKSEPWLAVSGMDKVDKERETAKNYIKPFLPVTGLNVVNVEFAEIVESSQLFNNLIANYTASKHMQRWKKVNNFLYDKKIWNSDPVKRYYEAELEANLNQHYVYS